MSVSKYVSVLIFFNLEKCAVIKINKPGICVNYYLLYLINPFSIILQKISSKIKLHWYKSTYVVTRLHFIASRLYWLSFWSYLNFCHENKALRSIFINDITSSRIRVPLLVEKWSVIIKNINKLFLFIFDISSLFSLNENRCSIVNLNVSVNALPVAKNTTQTQSVNTTKYLINIREKHVCFKQIVNVRSVKM